MTERQLVSKLMPHLWDIPNSWWYKIPDLPGGTTKRPFDIIGVVDGEPIAIECKMKGGKLKPHQQEALYDFYCANGMSYVFYFIDGKSFALNGLVYLFSEVATVFNGMPIIAYEIAHPPVLL